MAAKRDAAAAAAAAAAEVDEDDKDDDDVFDGGEGGCVEAGIRAAVRSSPSGDSFATLAIEKQVDKRFVGDLRLELSGLQDHLSVSSVRSPVDYVALPTVYAHCVPYCVLSASNMISASYFSHQNQRIKRFILGKFKSVHDFKKITKKTETES